MVARNEANREAGRLGPLALLQIELVIEVSFFAAATESETSVGLQIESPKLMSTSHSEDQGVSVDGDNIPG